MAAPSLDVDWESVKAHALTHGVREAARAFQLSDNTVMARSRREGWLADAGKAVVLQPLPKSMQPIARNARVTPSQAAQTSSLGERTKHRFARGIARASLKVAHMKGDTVLERAGEIKQLVDAGAKLYGWGTEANGPAAVVNLAFVGACGTPQSVPGYTVEH